MSNQNSRAKVLCVTFLLVLGWCAETWGADLTIGVIAGFSGEGASYGAAYRRGIELACSASHRCDGLRFIYEDDEFDPKKTVSAFRKLAEHNHVDALIVGDTTTAASIAALAETKKVPLFAWASESEIFRNKRFTIRTWPKFGPEMDAIDKGLSREDQSIALFTSMHAYSVGWGKAFAQRFRDRIVYQEEFSLPEQSYNSYLAKARSKGASAIALCLNAGDNGRLARTVAEMGWKAKIFGCSMLESTPDIAAAGPAFDGVWFAGTDILDSFRSRYVSFANSSDELLSAAIHNDIVEIIVASQSLPGTSLIDRLEQVRPISGAHSRIEFKIEAGDRYLELPFTRYVIRDGKT